MTRVGVDIARALALALALARYASYRTQSTTASPEPAAAPCCPPAAAAWTSAPLRGGVKHARERDSRRGSERGAPRHPSPARTACAMACKTLAFCVNSVPSARRRAGNVLYGERNEVARRQNKQRTRVRTRKREERGERARRCRGKSRRPTGERARRAGACVALAWGSAPPWVPRPRLLRSDAAAHAPDESAVGQGLRGQRHEHNVHLEAGMAGGNVRRGGAAVLVVVERQRILARLVAHGGEREEGQRGAG